MILLCVAVSASAAEGVFKPLQDYLVSAGLKPKDVAELFRHKEVKFEAKVMARLLATRESKLNYGQFLDKANVARAKKFVGKHRAALETAHKRTGVSPSLVVAILSVESRLGSYTGRWSVFNMLASQAVLDQPKALAEIKKHWPGKRLKYLKSKKFKARTQWRSQWGKKELLMLIHLGREEKRSPHAYRGSVAGAMGMGQFVPSSARRFGVDGDKDGKINLSEPSDAINSVAAFLRGHGWKPNLSRKKAEKVVYAYNRSTPYVKTVLELARRIEK